MLWARHCGPDSAAFGQLASPTRLATAAAVAAARGSEGCYYLQLLRTGAHSASLRRADACMRRRALRERRAMRAPTGTRGRMANPLRSRATPVGMARRATWALQVVTAVAILQAAVGLLSMVQWRGHWACGMCDGVRRVAVRSLVPRRIFVFL